jgi:hypothetical protein
MSEGFQRRRGGGAVATFTGFEADLLRSLASQLVELLRNEVAAPHPGDDPLEQMLDFSGPTTEPEDPVLARLFPDAYSEDQGASAEFRRYTEAGLRDTKRAAAQTVLETLGEGGKVYLDAEQAQAWLRSLNDLRLALGTRLDITEETLEQMRTFDWDDPRNAGYAAYDWLTYLQESLVRALW